jgi:hypothetical protein
MPEAPINRLPGNAAFSGLHKLVSTLRIHRIDWIISDKIEPPMTDSVHEMSLPFHVR